MRKIDADAAQIALHTKAMELINEGRSDDAVTMLSMSALLSDETLFPTLRPHWEKDDGGYYRCSECGWYHDLPDYTSPQCPRCRAEMDKGGKE